MVTSMKKAKLKVTYTIVAVSEDKHDHWIDTCASFEDARVSAESRGYEITDGMPNSYSTELSTETPPVILKTGPFYLGIDEGHKYFSSDGFYWSCVPEGSKLADVMEYYHDKEQTRYRKAKALRLPLKTKFKRALSKLIFGS